jgi:hypothetical protein
VLSNVISNPYPGPNRLSDDFFGIIPALIQAVQVRKADKNSTTKSSIRFLTGLCQLCCGLVFPALSANGLPSGGIVAEGNIVFPGNNTVDSFDSSNPNYSFWRTNWWFQGHNFGTYTNTRRTDQVMVGTDLNIITLNGGVGIYGYVNTGPGGAVPLKGNGNSVGDLAWIGSNPQSPLNTGIELGHARSDLHVVFSDVIGPIPSNSLYNAGTGFPNGRWLDVGYFSSGTNIGGSTYYYLVTNVVGLKTSPSNKVFYAIGSIIYNKASIFISASNCVLLMTNGISMKSGDNLTVDVAHNANVEIFTGATFDTGNGSVNNLYQYAPMFKIYGLPSCTSIVFPANATLTAWIYAPEADVTFNGGGSAPFDVAGAFTVHTITLKGHLNFHLDQVLRTNVPTPPWIFSSPSNQIIQLGSNATLGVFTGGDSPLYYQWFLEQTNPVAADINLFALSLTNVQFSDAGYYSVIVTNLYGSVTSAPASLIVYSNATPTLTIDSGSTNGQFQFDILGVTGLNYSIQASTNLIDWVPLGTNVSPFTFLDTNAPLFPQRFYRSVFMQ